MQVWCDDGLCRMHKLIRWAVLAAAMLSAYLVVELLEEFLLELSKTQGPYLATLLGMAMIVFVFVPLFAIIDSLSEKIVAKITGTAGKAFGKTGFYIFIALTLVALFAVYLHNWFNINLIERLF